MLLGRRERVRSEAIANFIINTNRRYDTDYSAYFSTLPLILTVDVPLIIKVWEVVYFMSVIYIYIYVRML
jgi:hypothetical protein